MPTITVEGESAFECEAGKKLVLAIEDAGLDILHRCGGQARCTTCRIEVLSGEVPPISEIEIEALEEPELIEHFRLSCQIRVQNDLSIRIAKRGHIEEMAVGPRPSD